jgi:hypothetical protein
VFRRLRFGEKVAALSALALFAIMFLDWFSFGGLPGNFLTLFGRPDVVAYAKGISWTGWDVGWFAVAACVLAMIAGLALPFVFALHESPVLPVLSAIMAMLLGGLAVVALIVQVIFQPGPDQLVEVRSGWWLGLLAAFGIARGGFLSMRDEYMPGVPLPDVPVRPAPVA